jgi:hypothetical protein
MRNPFNNSGENNMSFDYVTFATDWAGIPLSIRYCPDWCSITAHLEISSRDGQPLPITETGYRSHFTSTDAIEAEGGPVSFACAWLDHAAQSPAWQDAQESRHQLSFF